MKTSEAVDLTQKLACVEAAVAMCATVEPEQILAALTKIRQLCYEDNAEEAKAFGIDVAAMQSDLNLVSNLLESVGVNPDKFRRTLRAKIGRGQYKHQKGVIPENSYRSERIYRHAEEIAQRETSSEIGVGHLFLAVIQEQEGLGRRLLAKIGIDIAELIRNTRNRLGRSPLSPDHKTMPVTSYDISHTPDVGNPISPAVPPANQEADKKVSNVVRMLKRCSQEMSTLLCDMNSSEKSAVYELAMRIAHDLKNHLAVVSQTKLHSLESNLKAAIIAQDQAIEQICQYILAIHSGILYTEGNGGIILFQGPSGVGKTKLARALAAHLLDSEERLIRYDMACFSNKDDERRLYELLFDRDNCMYSDSTRIRKQHTSFSITLLESIHLAHVNVINMLSRIFQNTFRYDVSGHPVLFKPRIFILESTVLTQQDGSVRAEIARDKDTQNKFLQILDMSIDEQIVFNPLKRDDVKEIIKKRLSFIGERFTAKYQCSVHWGGPVIEQLTSSVYSDGACLKELDRIIRRQVELPLAKLPGTGSIKEFIGITSSLQGQQIKLEPCRGSLPTA
jgi:ATP-dependent Clp protease ATP-binding subunit ClpA